MGQGRSVEFAEIGLPRRSGFPSTPDGTRLKGSGSSKR